MAFRPKETKKKVESVYKTIYLSKDLADRIDGMVKEYDTSFNNVVVSMIEACLNDEEDDPRNP